jgi:hypothetical protein
MKQTLEEASERIISDMGWAWENTESSARMVARHCAKLQEKSYSEEDIKLAFEAGHKKGFSGYPNTENWKELPFKEWFEKHKKK